MCWKSVDLLFSTRNLITKLKPEHRIGPTTLRVKLDEDIDDINQIIFNDACSIQSWFNFQELCWAVIY